LEESGNFGGTVGLHGKFQEQNNATEMAVTSKEKYSIQFSEYLQEWPPTGEFEVEFILISLGFAVQTEIHQQNKTTDYWHKTNKQKPFAAPNIIQSPYRNHQIGHNRS
jgi:hypothetical protein